MAVPVFTYGTLRIGNGLYHAYKHLVAAHLADCSVGGAMYSLGPFPTIDLDADGTIHGDVLNCLVGEGLDSMIRMEEGAGYLTVLAPVVMPDASTLVCVMFQGGRNLGHPNKELIPSGDWNAHERNQRNATRRFSYED